MPQQNQMEAQSPVAQEIAEFYLAYIDAMNRLDMDRYTAGFAYPFIVINTEDGMQIYHSHREHEPSYVKLFQDLKARGWTKNVVTGLGVLPLGSDCALLFSEITRYRDKEILEVKRFCYSLKKTAQSWKICTTTRVSDPLPLFCKKLA